MKPTSAPTAYSYVRFSHQSQAEGDSLRRQTEAAKAWCDRNRVRLDTATTLHDLGKSAYTGAHRQNPDRHALAGFLELVNRGRIPRGSFLIVESLDRLSREDIIPALSLLLDLIRAGVSVVQLIPVEAVYDATSNPMNLMMAMMELSRGHSESKVKSERNRAKWREKRKAVAAGSRAPLTARVPAWLRVVGGRLVADPAKAEAVRLIYRLAAAGY